jgi:hypothetical protein
MDLTDLVRDPGVIEYPLGGRGLTGIDVGHDADIPSFIECYFTCHGDYSSTTCLYQR